MADSSKPYGNVAYADPGYQADKKARYPIDTKSHAKAAWSYVNQADNAKLYTAAQLKRVRGRIIKALKRFGVSVSTTEALGWTFDQPFKITEAVQEWMGEDPQRSGSWCITAGNGPVSLSLSSYCMDPADLSVILRAAADAACKALAALDPDMDGDIDLPGVGPASDTDQDHGESTEDAGDTAETARPDEAGETGPAEAGHRTEQEAPMGETTGTQAAGTQPAAPALTAEQIAQLAATAATEAVTRAFAARDAQTETDAARAARKAAKRERRTQEAAALAAATAATAAGTGTTEAAPAATGTTETAAPAPVDVGALVTEAVQALVADGTLQVSRKGIAAPPATGQATTEHTAPAGTPGGKELPGEDLRKLSSDDFTDYAGEALDVHVFGARGKAVH